MKLHLSLNEPKSDDASGYSESTKLSESIIGAGVVLFLTSLMVIGIICACSAFVKKETLTEKNPTGQMTLSENATKPSIEIIP